MQVVQVNLNRIKLFYEFHTINARCILSWSRWTIAVHRVSSWFGLGSLLWAKSNSTSDLLVWTRPSLDLTRTSLDLTRTSLDLTRPSLELAMDFTRVFKDSTSDLSLAMLSSRISYWEVCTSINKSRSWRRSFACSIVTLFWKKVNKVLDFVRVWAPCSAHPYSNPRQLTIIN